MLSIQDAPESFLPPANDIHHCAHCLPSCELLSKRFVGNLKFAASAPATSSDPLTIVIIHDSRDRACGNLTIRHGTPPPLLNTPASDTVRQFSTYCLHPHDQVFVCRREKAVAVCAHQRHGKTFRCLPDYVCRSSSCWC